MKDDVWILDEVEDNRELARMVLVRAGVAALEFSSPEQLIEHVAGAPPPTALVVDAVSARGWERAIVGAVRSRLVVLTTWPLQRLPWAELGATSFLLKPYDVYSLVDHVAPGMGRPRGPAAARGTVLRRPAA